MNKNDLNPTLRATLMDIARPAPKLEFRANGWSDETDRQDDLKRPEKPRADFSVQFEGSITVIWPLSQKGSDWMSEHLPEDCPRWGATGYAIETNYIADIITGMIRDELEQE